MTRDPVRIPSRRVAAQWHEGLTTIATYVLPVFTLEGRRVVPLENAQFLRDTARQALDGTLIVGDE